MNYKLQQRLDYRPILIEVSGSKNRLGSMWGCVFAEAFSTA